MAKEEKLKGVEKAAILMMHLGEDLASGVAKFMSHDEMKAIGGSIARRESVPLHVRRNVASEFLEVASENDVDIEGLEFARNLINRSMRPESARSVLDQIAGESSGSGMDALKWMEPSLVANMISGEHPQIIALILAHLDSEKAAQVLLCIPDERMRGEIMLRVATLKRIPQAAVKDLEEIIKDQMDNTKNNFGNTVEGVKVAAEILNLIESNPDGTIMGIIEKAKPDLAVQIKEMIFAFSDLLTVDDRGIQLIIKELSADVLTVALKGAETELKEKFLKNMSERAADIVRYEMEAKGPVRLLDVEKAQHEITKVARRLEQEGKVVRAGKGGDVLV